MDKQANLLAFNIQLSTLLPILQADEFFVRAVVVPEPEGVGFDNFQQGDIFQFPPRDPSAPFSYIKSG